jgi:hypothetical protein
VQGALGFPAASRFVVFCVRAGLFAGLFRSLRVGGKIADDRLIGRHLAHSAIIERGGWISAAFRAAPDHAGAGFRFEEGSAASAMEQSCVGFAHAAGF